MTVVAVIPARYGSVRFPGKPLADLGGKPLIAHVVDRAREAQRVDEVIVATDDERIARAVEEHGGTAVMTSSDCATGTDRIAEAVASRPDADIIVNVQGDEPLMPPDVIDRVVEALQADPDCAVSTAMIRIRTEEDYLSPHVVKVVCDGEGRALYFSRSPLPNMVRASERDLVFARDFFGEKSEIRNPKSETNPKSQIQDSELGAEPFYGFKHFGLYVYRREALLRYVELPQSPLERLESLEQLRLLENGMVIRVVETDHDSIGVDTPEDLERAAEILAAGGNASAASEAR